MKKDETKRKKGKGLLKTLSSMVFANIILIILAGVSIIGTIIPQNPDVSSYIQKYGRLRYDVFDALGLFDLYHSWWFITLLIILFGSIVVCIVRRLPLTLRMTFKTRTNVNVGYIKNLKNNAHWECKSTIVETNSKIDRILGKRGFKVAEEASGEKLTIYARKGKIGPLGSHLIHISILVIMLGSILGNILGFEDSLLIEEGDSHFIKEGNFGIRVEDFEVEYYEDSSRPKEFTSIITVIENEKDLFTKEIEVNHPLKYRGIWLYQSSYFQSWRRIKSTEISVKDKNDGEVLGAYTVGFNEEFYIPETNLKIKAVDFIADFWIDMESKVPASRSREHNNPAIHLEVYENEILKASPWIFLLYPGMHPTKGIDYDFELVDYVSVWFTGLQVKKDPGVNLVWLGCGLMVIGILISFLVFFKRIWIRMIQKDKKVEVYVGGLTNKDRQVFAGEFERIVGEMKDITMMGN